MLFYAHSKKSGDYQLLKKHLEKVAALTREFAGGFGAGELGYLAGLIHDVGKYSEMFQQRIRGSHILVDHSTAGAQWIMKPEVVTEYIGRNGFAPYLARLIAYVVAGHHVGLRNYGSLDEEESLKYRLSKTVEEVPDWSKAWSELSICSQPLESNPMLRLRNLTKDNLAWKYSFLGRMLYSCLVDADSIDTRDYCNDEDRRLMTKRNLPEISQLLKRFNEFIYELEKKAKKTKINYKRHQILEICRREAMAAQGLFILSIPTGGGKTLSSLCFALHHAQEYQLQRVIYVIPFLSIIDQTVEIFRDALGNEAVLEHHSNFDEQEYKENYGAEEARKQKLAAENWDAPVVVTTSVQFFESLFSNKRSKCRKLHHISNSVIIIDEAQSIPRGYLTPCLRALEELVESYGCSVVLYTATHPSWEALGIHPSAIIQDQLSEQLIDTFKRVRITLHGGAKESISDSVVIDWMSQANQVLTIVNTRKHAKVLFDLLNKKQLKGVYHLSGRLCPKHCMKVLKEIKERLFYKKTCYVISTQLVEAGVDLDFPMVIRAFAGLDSIAQAAGRCNREGEPLLGEVHVFYPELHGLPYYGWMKETAIEAQNVLTYQQADPLSPEAMQHYFDRIYGISDGRVEEVTDSKRIMDLLKSKNVNLEIPYEEIANRFELIEGEMFSIIIPFDESAQKWIHTLAESKVHRPDVFRQLQSYSVSVYNREYDEWINKGLLSNAGGILYLNDMDYYDQASGLREPL
ncbi:CRISPR-associated helicase Cas3' [Paenibacillus azoreducens]|uniref:CRISPR-associated helicase Cas3' n=1 Tax=Paenibacillus azoreducens TaxID=116718 RepID=UPI0039F5C4E2